MNLELSPITLKNLEGLIATGEFKSADEVVSEGVRLLLGRQQLRAELQKGIGELDAGLGIPGQTVFAELRERAAKISGSAG